MIKELFIDVSFFSFFLYNLTYYFVMSCYDTCGDGDEDIC